MAIQGCGVSRSRRRFGGIEFLTTLGTRVGFLSVSDSGSPIGSLLHHTPKLGIPVESGTITHETFVETKNSCCVSRFPLSVSCYKILVAKLHSLYVKKPESEILERSELKSDILPPTHQPWMPYLNDGLY